MLPHEPGLRVNVGVSGAGKTHYLRNDACAAAHHIPVIVIDAMHEWDYVPDALVPVTKGALTVDDAVRQINAGARMVIVRPDNHVAAAARAAWWAQTYPGVAGIVIPEAHNVAPVSGPVPVEIDRVATAWRHHKVAMWCDTQRIARLHHSITDNAREMRVFAQWGDADMGRIWQVGGGSRGHGAALVAAVTECARKLAPVDEGGDNEPGWYIYLGMNRVPPFTPRRDSR